MELKKTRKKALALVLAACVTGTSSAPVFAAEDLFTDTPVVETPDFGTEAASTGNVYVEQVVFNDSGNYISVDVKDYIDISGYIEENGEMKAQVNAKTLESYLPANYELVGETFVVRNGYIAADIQKKTTVTVKEIVFNDNGKYITVNVGKALKVAEYVEDVAYISAEDLKGYLPANYELKSTDNVAVRDGYVAADIQKKTIEVGYLQLSGEGMETVQTEVKLGTTVPLMNFLGKVPEGKVFAGWTLDGKKVYAAGENFTFDKALAQDMGISADGVQGYLFSFKASFEDAKATEAGYLQFEGMDNFVEVELGSTLPLMNYHGEVPEGKVFAGWTLDGKKVYAAGESFTFDKALAQDMGTNEDGVQGYLFSFKASFEDVKAKETGYIQFSGEGMETVQTEVKLGTTVPLMNFLGKVPEGKVFAGWTLDGKKVYAAGESFTFDKALAQDMGTNEDGVQGYLFSFKAAFDAAEKKINVVFKTKTGNVISNKAMMVPYTEKYVDASKLTAPKGYKLVSKGKLEIVNGNVTVIITKNSAKPVRKDIGKLSFSGVKKVYSYTGRDIKPKVTIKDGKKVLKVNRDYTITYKNNKRRGTATIIITGKGNYTGKKVLHFAIRKI